MRAHGPLVSLIEYYNRFPRTLYPLVNTHIEIDYPLGMHILIATLNKLWNLFPGQAVLVYGGILSSLIPPLFFLLTYSIAKSNFLSLVGALTSFFIHPSGIMTKWILGHFFNGTYPNLTALTIIIAMMIIEILSTEKNLKNKIRPPFFFLLIFKEQNCKVSFLLKIA